MGSKAMRNHPIVQGTVTNNSVNFRPHLFSIGPLRRQPIGVTKLERLAEIKVEGFYVHKKKVKRDF